MKKIMFNDRYSLTEAVLSGRKTQTRRIVKRNQLFKRDPDGMWTDDEKKAWEKSGISESDFKSEEDMNNAFEWLIAHAPYKVREVVAVAQSYADAGFGNTAPIIGADENDMPIFASEAGVYNKMFVRADQMPHQIRITNVRVEKLQDIGDVDCLDEGIEFSHKAQRFYVKNDSTTGARTWLGDTPREAYAVLIDRVSGKGMWESNPWVFVYDFELVK